MPYILANSIYQDWTLFIKPIKNVTDVKEHTLIENQEAAPKEVERFLGVKKARFKILRREQRSWEMDDIVAIENACVIFHNLMVRMQQNGDFETRLEGRK